MNDEKALFRREHGGFVPNSALAQEVFEKIKVGECVEMTTKRYRSLAFHNKYMAMIRACAENTDYTFEEFLDRVKIAVGHARTIVYPDGTVCYSVSSIKFEKMDELAFQKFYDDSFKAIERRLLPGISDENVRERILAFG